MLPNLSTDGQDNTTFEGKKYKPKLKGRTLGMKDPASLYPHRMCSQSGARSIIPTL